MSALKTTLRAGLAGMAALAASGQAGAAQPTAMSVISHDLTFAIGRCYAPPKDVAPPFPAVGLLLNFRPDGQLDGPPQVIDPPGGGPKVQAVRNAVLAAAVRCARIDQAKRFQRDYIEWRSIRIFFKPGPDK